MIRPMGRPIRTIDRFAELLSEHDLATGDPGGNVRKCAGRMGMAAQDGNALMQRIRRGLGWQAK